MKKSKVESIRFVKVNVLPPQDEEFYQLFRGGVATDFIVSKSRLLKCLSVLEEYERANSN